MSSLTRVLKNSIALTIGKIINLLASLGIYALIGRILGAEGLGQFSFILTYIGLFIALSSLGTHLYITREISREREQLSFYLGKSLSTILLFTPIVIGLLLLGPQIIFPVAPEVHIGIALGGIYLILGTIILVFYGVFQAFERMEFELWSTSIEHLLGIAITAFVLYHGWGVISLVLGYVLSRVISLGLCLFLYRKYIGPWPSLSFGLRSIKDIGWKSIPFALNILTTTIYVQLDLILLTLWKGNTAGGYYKAATSLVIPLSILAISFNRSLFPNMARAFVTSHSYLNRLIETSIRYLFLLGWPIAIGIFLLASSVVNIVYDEGFDFSVACLQILIWIVPMRYINNTLGTTLTAINKQGLRSAIIFGSAALNLILNVFMIPAWSFIGASISTVITEIFITIVLLSSISGLVPLKRVVVLTWRPLISGLAMGGLVYALKDLNLILVISVGILVYLVALWLTNSVPKEDQSKILDKVKPYVERIMLIRSKP